MAVQCSEKTRIDYFADHPFSHSIRILGSNFVRTTTSWKKFMVCLMTPTVFRISKTSFRSLITRLSLLLVEKRTFGCSCCTTPFTTASFPALSGKPSYPHLMRFDRINPACHKNFRDSMQSSVAPAIQIPLTSPECKPTFPPYKQHDYT